MPPQDRGFTLLEVMVSLMLVGILSTVVFMSYAVMLRTMAMSQRFVQAQGVAERAILMAQARPCDYEGESQPHVAVVQDDGVSFERALTATALPGERLWRFHVTVSWTQFGRRQQTQLVTHQSLTIFCPHWVYPYGRP